MKPLTTALIAAALIASPAAAQDAKTQRDWALSLSGGTTMIGGSSDQPLASIGITRNFGDSYVRLSGTYVDSAGEDGAALSVVPASTKQLTLAVGTVTGALGIDGYVSVGDRNFDARAFTTRTGRTLTLESGGSSLGAGLSLTWELPVGDNALIAPFVAGDYSRIDISRAIALPGGDSLAEKSREDGFTGSAGATALLLFGSDQQHSIGLYGAFVASGNNSAYNGTNAARATALGIGDQPGVSDEWIDYGATASFALGRAVTLDLGVVRTAGFLGDEATSVTGGVRLAF